MDGVAGSTGHGRHDVALLTEQGIGHGGLSDIGTPHDGDARKLLLPAVPFVGRQCGHDGIHQVARTAAAHRTDGVGLSQSQCVEFGGTVELFAVVHLIDHEKHLLVGTAQNVGHEHVEVGDTGTHLGHEEYHVGLVDGQHHLPPYLLLKHIFAVHRIPTRVDDGKFAAVPVRAPVVTVAGGTGRRIHDGLPHSHQPVEQGTLPHIGTPDDSYYAHDTRFLNVPQR